MIAHYRKAFNENFQQASYEAMLDWIEQQHNYRLPFRVAETPVFVPDYLRNELFRACEEIAEVIARPDFKELSANAVPEGQSVPHETPHTTFLQMDFGICVDKYGNLVPQLIEVQGFPSLYFFQDLVARAYRMHFDIPETYSHLFDGLDSHSYVELLRKVIVGDSNPENVILLEVEPRKQATEIDFIAGRDILGVEYLCVTDLKMEGKDVYYLKDGKKIGVEKIYNRVIFDELIRRDDLQREFYFSEDANVQWVGHPNWFFRISKHTLPLIDSPFVPKSYFLNELDEYPEDLYNYVLKPLYSFAGTGVIINLSSYDLDMIQDPEHYILQRKVSYAPVVETPTDPAKCEIRMLMIWPQDEPKPRFINNLARLSKGEMVGVRYNRDKDWVGGSVGFFRKEL